MTEYDIGGGEKIQIPDNLDAETRLKLAEVIKDEYGIDINQTSALEQAKEFGKAIPRGIASLALDVPTGIVGLFDIGNDSNLYKGLEGLQDRLRQDSVLAADPRYADKFSTKLGEGVGSFVPFLGAGMVGRALAKAPGAAKGFLSPTFTAPTALAIPTGIAAQGDRLQMAREMGEDVSGLTETTAELFGGLIGITEVVPIASILGKVHKNAPLSYKEQLVSALQSGALEGGQEVLASVLQDGVARGLYSEDLPMADSMFEEFTIGGIIGGAADLVVTSMAGKQSARRKRLEEDNLRSQENKEKLILAKKQKQAVQQGVLEEMQDIPSVTVPQLIPEEELGPEPSVEVIVTPQEQFAVVDISNPEAPVQIDIKEKEIDAIKKRDEITKNYNFKKLKSKLDNDTYNLGLINSKAAYDLGQSLEDNRASGVSIQDLIDSVPKDSKQEVNLRGLVNGFVAQNPGKTSRSYPRLSMAEAKKLLTAKQFNEFTSAVAQGAFTHSENNGKPSIIADKDTIDTSAKYVKEIAASKNIDLNFQSPAVQYAAEKYTGTPEFSKMKKGQKELFLARIHALSPFNSRTTFPDFRPRNYTAQEMADFVANAKSNNIIFDKNTLLKVGPDSIRKNEVATKQFIDDLIYSGRAQQVEGTNNYKIRDNFEFDIARKAEGFNETPEEFGARLTAEGVLPAETIADLVEKERTNQENLLPPVEIEPKFINYAETLQEGKVSKFAKELRKRLDGVGLKDTGIVVSDDIISTTTLRRVDGEIKYDPRRLIDPRTGDKARGEYDKNTDTIFISLNAVNPDGGATEVEIIERLRGVLDHEMIHALRAKDLITEAEYQYLKKQVEQQKVPNTNTTFLAQAQGTYSDIAAKTRTSAEATEFLYEEAIAELFRKKDLLVNTPPKVDGIFNKIIQFFKTAGQAMRSSGYKSATEIFNNIESGRVGARERGVVRTTRLVDKGLIPANFLTTEERDEVIRTPEPIPGDEIRQTIGPKGIRPKAVPKRKRTGTTKPPASTGPATPPTTPTTIYNSRTLSNAQYNSEREKIIKGLQDAKILDKDVFDKDGNVTKTIKGNNDSVKMMKWLIDNSPSQDYKIIAQKVHKSLLALKKQGRSFPLNFKVGDTNGLTGRIRGQISPSGKEDKFGQPFTYSMSLNDDGKGFNSVPLARDQAYKDWKSKNGVNFETILHESIHQATLAQIYAASGSPSILAKLSPDGGSKALKAQKELRNQANRIKNHYRSKMRFYEDLSDKILQDVSTGDQTNLEIYKEAYAKAPEIEKTIADIYIREYSDGIITRTESGLRKDRKRNFENYHIKYQLYGQQPQNRGDVSELLTFGLTNRNFQEMLESIPLGKDATDNLWNKFVEVIRELLAVPAKLNTELSAFLKNASTVLDLQTTGINLDTRDVRDVPLFSRPPRDESSGHVADGVPAQYGPPAHDLNAKPSQEEFTPEGYSTFDVTVDYNRLREYSTARPQERAEEQRFLNKLKQIKGNPNAEITMYQAAPQRDLREGDLITPFLSEAEALVEDSKVTQQEIRDAELQQLKQDLGLDKDTTPNINLVKYYNERKKMYSQMDGIMDVFGAPQTTPSKIHTFKLKAGDVRWDGNNGWARWGYFPSKVKDISGDIPTFSRAPSRFPTTQEQINNASQQLLEDSLSYYNNLVEKTEKELFQDVLRPDERTTLERRRYNAEAVVAKTERRLEELRTGTGQLPLFSRKRRDDTGTNSQENIQLREALEEAEETVKQTPRGSIPYYNLNASDTALKAAIDFNRDLSATAPDDIPKFSRPTLDGLDNNLQEFIKRTGGEVLPDQSWGARLIEIVKDPITAIKNFFINFRQRYIDQYDDPTKTILAGKTTEWYLGIDERTDKLRINPKTKKPWTQEEAEIAAKDVTLANMFANTGAEQSLRMSDKSRGVFQGMLTRGIAVDQIDDVDSLVKTIPLELVDADGNKTGKTGGLIQILAPLFSNVDVNLEAVFKSYAILKRAKNLDESGREIDTPVQPNDYALIEQIEQQHPEVVEVYRNYQNWNNSLIQLAERKGILSTEQSALWREHSVYYPFYRQMVDDSGIKGPAIAGGSLPGNPLDIKIEGSEEIIDADPIEAISRNSLSILTASLKNDAMGKIVKNLETMGLAKSISAKDAGKADSLFFFENGIKRHYQVDDPRLVYGLQNIGGVAPGAIGKFLAIPAGLLRDTVTRDPGFVVINILRDTLSSAVTSGAPYTPIIDSVKNMFGSMEELEQFGVLGGYDYSIDEGSVKQFITKTMRQQGLTPNNAMSPTGAFFKLWDGLGALTTKSDGATRKAVYDVVYKQLKEDGYSEAVAQSEAAYQAQEIINFGRRGSDPLFRIITAAIPFLNARIQGLDVLHRGLTGKYSAVEKQQMGESLKEVQSRILRRTALNASLLVGLTALYYMMVSDTDEYKNLKREVRDDNWIFPTPFDYAIKIPIPFEVGMLFKAIPERVFDMTMGDDAFTRKSVDEALTSIERQVSTSFNIPFLGPGSGIQLLKPIAEVMNNRNTFTDTEIVPYYQQQKEPGLQARATTNEFARILGESLNISPAKIEHIMRGYTGTLGGYVLAVIDTITRGATGSPLLPSNFELSKMPVFNRLLLDLDKSGGYQQQFYELRGEVDRAVATINSLQKQQRFDELSAYRSNMQGVLNVKGQVRAIERYLDNWRKRRDRLMRDENISVSVKSDMLRELELERDMRLAMVPELRKRANIPVLSLNL